MVKHTHTLSLHRKFVLQAFGKKKFTLKKAGDEFHGKLCFVSQEVYINIYKRVSDLGIMNPFGRDYHPVTLYNNNKAVMISYSALALYLR